KRGSSAPTSQADSGRNWSFREATGRPPSRKAISPLSAAPSHRVSSSRALKWRRQAGSRAADTVAFVQPVARVRWSAARRALEFAPGAGDDDGRGIGVGHISTVAGLAFAVSLAATATYANEGICPGDPG